MKRYRIISELGKGATGVVYKAVRGEDGTTVALKKLILPSHLDANQEEEFIKRFKSEAKASLELKHSGIVGSLDCGLDEGTLYIAYELVEGVTLDEAMKSGRTFSPEEIADMIAQIAEALEYAHSEGVVHRDLSPGNIFITNDGKARVTDFGVAGFTSQATLTPGDQSIVGTPGYMAPEQITGGEADPRSDIFSLGCVAYELLSGEKAFTGDNLAQIIHRVINEQPKPIREFNPKTPLALEEIVFRMLAKNPDYRYQSMGEVQTAALRVLEEIPRKRKAEESADVGHAPVLVAVAGPHEGEIFPLQSTVTTIGRTIGDILLSKDEQVAQQHAWITKEETGWVLYDADSETGTLLNGEEIEREEILAGDNIKIGGSVLEFRGAGGHAGAFRDDAEAVVADAKMAAKTQMQIPKRTPWALIIFLSVPGIIVIAGLIVIGLVLPYQIRADLDAATVGRWDSAFGTIDQTGIGDIVWTQDAADVLAEWDADPLDYGDGTEENVNTGPANYMAPEWVIGSGRINDEVLYRFGLFQFADEFLEAVVYGGSGTTNITDPNSVLPALQTVRALETGLEGLEFPSGADQMWEGRKFQLLSVIRRWIAAVTGGVPDAGIRAFIAEKERAEELLLDGWYMYREAGSNVMLLDNAIRQFQICIQTLDPVLMSDPEDEEAKAMRGLAYYIGAKILRQAGSTDRYIRALGYLDSAESDIIGVSDDSWDDTIPVGLRSEYSGPRDVLSQIRALRAALLAMTPSM